MRTRTKRSGMETLPYDVPTVCSNTVPSIHMRWEGRGDEWMAGCLAACRKLRATHPAPAAVHSGPAQGQPNIYAPIFSTTKKRSYFLSYSTFPEVLT